MRRSGVTALEEEEKDPTSDRERVLLDGEPPDPVDIPSGCAFAPRCPKATAECREVEPGLDEAGDGAHSAACYFPVDGESHDGDRTESNSMSSTTADD
ncbi:oligopeptide/dipeptide ABC transporter ATP-binding protein [Halarchaeum solikamskense]|nr:oligopeptide/dipeptide ABC transporter ATP-binding protein [Halarchaeum solikamskense]